MRTSSGKWGNNVARGWGARRMVRAGAQVLEAVRTAEESPDPLPPVESELETVPSVEAGLDPGAPPVRLSTPGVNPPPAPATAGSP